jgi:hypothetical protein
MELGYVEHRRLKHWDRQYSCALYITLGSQLYIVGVQLNFGELSVVVQNDTDQDIDALLFVGGLLI